MGLDPSILSKVVKQAEHLEIQEDVFGRFVMLLDSISEGLDNVTVTPDVQPCFMHPPGSSKR